MSSFQKMFVENFHIFWEKLKKTKTSFSDSQLKTSYKANKTSRNTHKPFVGF